MSAPVLKRVQIKHSIRSKKKRASKMKSGKPTVKNVLLNPFYYTDKVWPKVDKEIQEKILAEFKSTTHALELKGLKEKEYLSEENEGKQKDGTVVTKNIMKLIIIGVNNVTKHLCRDKLCLVLTCRSTKPPLLIRHLISLTAVRGCPAACIDGLSKTMSELFDIQSAAAIGFKKTQDTDEQGFDDFVRTVQSLIPPVTQSQLPSNKSGSEMKKEASPSIAQGTASDLKVNSKHKESESVDSEVDFSYLYILKDKQESKPKVVKNILPASSFGEDFISLKSGSDKSAKLGDRKRKSSSDKDYDASSMKFPYKQTEIVRIKSKMVNQLPDRSLKS